MDYRNLIESTSVDFKVNNHLLEFGPNTWQISNIAATSIGKTVIPFNVPEPRYEVPEPKLELSLFSLVVVTVVTWLAVRFVLGSTNYATLIVLGVVGVIIYVKFKSLNAEKSVWQSEKSKVEGHRMVWNEMRQNPPVLFSLLLETNAGSKPLFYSLDEYQILKANDLIKSSMEKKGGGDIVMIETVNIGGEDSINNFGSNIYHQSIQGT